MNQKLGLQCWLQVLAVFVVALLSAFLLFQSYDPGVLDPDTYYHFLVSREMATTGSLWVDIKWLPYTVLGEAGPDHHWLWHLLFAPLGLLADPQLGLVLALCIGFALVPAGLVLLLWQAGVGRYAWLWAIVALVASEVLLGRFMTLRVQNLALLLLLASVLALYQRGFIALFIVGFVFMASYHGAVILAPLGMVYLGWSWLARGAADWRPVLVLAGGAVAGLLITPWPGQNISYLLFHTLYKTSVVLPGMAGTEWQRLPWLDFLREAWLAHLVLVASVLAWWRAAPQLSWRGRLGAGLPGLLLLVCLLLLVLYAQSWRFVEYYAPVAIFTAALLLHSAGFGVSSGANSGVNSRVNTGLAKSLAVALVCLGLLSGWRASERVLQAQAYNAADYAQVLDYLADNANQGEMVVNSHWPDFPMLLWPQARYRLVTGLDGSYLAFQDPARFTLWWQLAGRDYPYEGDIAQHIGESFDSRWVVVARGHETLHERLLNSPTASLVATAKAAYLFEIRRAAAADQGG